MALSILTCGGNTHGLYDSTIDSFIKNGSEKEMEDWKHTLELHEQRVADRKHFDELRVQYIKQLIAGGMSPAQAIAFLKRQMPFLF